jgi:hypothetical protein
MARYVRIRLTNGDARHATLRQDETHTQWAAPRVRRRVALDPGPDYAPTSAPVSISSK